MMITAFTHFSTVSSIIQSSIIPWKCLQNGHSSGNVSKSMMERSWNVERQVGWWGGGFGLDLSCEQICRGSHRVGWWWVGIYLLFAFHFQCLPSTKETWQRFITRRLPLPGRLPKQKFFLILIFKLSFSCSLTWVGNEVLVTILRNSFFSHFIAFLQTRLNPPHIEWWGRQNRWLIRRVEKI